MERVDLAAGLLNVLGDGIGNELVDDLLQVDRAHLLVDGVHHGAADVADLRVLRVRRLLLRVGVLLGEADAEDAQQVAVGGLDVYVGLDQRLHADTKTLGTAG